MFAFFVQPMSSVDGDRAAVPTAPAPPESMSFVVDGDRAAVPPAPPVIDIPVL